MIDTKDRVLALSGSRNLRDMGGYGTTDGRTVKWGVLFRSGYLFRLDQSAVDHLRGLNVQVVCDLRTSAERAQEPSAVGITDREYLAFDYNAEDNALYAAGAGAGASPERVRSALIDSYALLPWRLADQFRGAFQHIVEGDLPLIFHCSGGKDRTGILAGLILTILSVPRETILEDYALTDQLLNAEQALLARPRTDGTPAAGVAALSAEMRAPILRTDPAYLESALDAVEARCGSVEGYLNDVLGIDDAGIQAIKDRLLDPA